MHSGFPLESKGPMPTNGDSTIKNQSKILRTRGLFLLFFAAFSTYLYSRFVFDTQVKLYIQKTLSELNGAKVTIGNVESKLLEGRFTLTDIQFANPIAPMRNTFQVDKITARLAVAPLFRKKLNIQQMEVQEIHYWTPRQEPGVFSDEMSLAVVKAALLDRASTGIYSGIRNELTDNPLRHLGQLGSGFTLSSKLGTLTEKLNSIRHLRGILSDLRENEVFWERQKAALPSPANLAGLKARIRKKNQKTLSDLSPKTELEQKIKSTSQDLESLRTQISELSVKIEKTEEHIKKDVGIVRRELGLPNTDYKDITHLTFGPTWLSLIEKLSYWLEFSRSRSPVGKRTENYAVTVIYQKQGRSVHFGKMGALPTFLLDQASVVSGLEKGSKAIRMEGKITGVTSDPALYRKPTRFHLTADYPEKNFRHLELSGFIDHTQSSPQENFKLTLPSFLLQEWPITRTPDVQLEIKRALAGLTVTGNFEGDNVDLDWEINLTETEYGIESRFRQVEMTLENLLGTLYSFNVIGELKGPLNNIKFSSSSDLGKRLAEGLKSEFRHEFGALDEAIETETRNLLPPLQNDIRARLHKLETEVMPQFEKSLSQLNGLL